MSERKSNPNPALAAVVRAVVARRGELDPWLEFPQGTCVFVFGPKKRPMPIGALYHLWDAGPPWRKPCLRYGGDLRGLACGGLLTFSWMSQVCLDCEESFYETSGNSIAAALSWLRPLDNTEFHTTGGSFGGAHESGGQKLLRVIGLSYRPDGSVKLSAECGGTDPMPTRSRFAKSGGSGHGGRKRAAGPARRPDPARIR